MQSLKTLLLISLLLPAAGYAQASQTFYFGEGQSTPQSHHTGKPGHTPPHHRHASRHSQQQSPNAHP